MHELYRRPVQASLSICLILASFLRSFSIANAQTRIGVLTLAPGEQIGFNNSAVIDTVTGFAYFGTVDFPTGGGTITNGKIVEVKLSDFTRVDALAVPGISTPAVIDTTNGFAYFGTDISPAKILTIDLSTFSRVGAVPLKPDDGSVLSAIIDNSGYMYLGTSSNSGFSGRIVKLSIRERTQSVTAFLSTTSMSTSQPIVPIPVQTVSKDSAQYILVAVAVLITGIFGSSILLVRHRRFTQRSLLVCRNCGFNNPRYAKSFCVKCGNRLVADRSPSKESDVWQK